MPGEDLPVVLTLDHAQPRIYKERQQTTISGGVRGEGGDYLSQWQGLLSEDVLIDPITFRTILMPAFFHEDWKTSGIEPYARLRKTDYVDEFGAALGSDWREDTVLHSSDYYLLSQSATPGLVMTSDTWEQNRGFAVSLFQFTTGTDEREIFQCGWGELGDTLNSALSYRIFSSGRAEVWRYGEINGEGSIAGTKNDRGPSSRGQDLGPRFIGLFFLPWCIRDVLLLTTAGGGFNHTLTDIPEDATPEEAIITPADSRFWWYTPSGTAKVQAAPAWFLEEGFAVGVKSIFYRAPDVGRTEDFTLYEDLTTQPGLNASTGSLVAYDDIDVPFVPDGTEKRCRVRVDLSGDGIGTPVLHAASAEYVCESEDTNDSEQLEVLDYCTALNLDVQDGVAGNRVTVDFMKTTELEDAGAAGLLETDCRPIKFEIGAFFVVDGIGSAPKFADAIEDAVRKVSFEVRDFTRQMEEYEYSDNVPLDGLEIADIHRKIAKDAGIPEERVNVSPAAYTIPLAGSQSKGDWNTQIQPADTALDWQTRIHETYSGRSFFGVVPVDSGAPELQLILEGDLETEPDITLYDNDDEAYAALVLEGYSASEAARLRFTRVYRSWDSHPIPCLANQIWVTGQDPRTRRPIVAVRDDLESQDPTVPPSMRVRNWVGGLRKYGLIDPTLTTDEAVEGVADLLEPRLTKAPIAGEFTCELLLRPASTQVIWKSRVVRLYRSGEFADWRIQSFGASHVKEPQPDLGDLWRWRPARYLVTKIEDEDGKGESSNYELGGASMGVAGVLERRKALRQARRKIRRGGEHLAWAMPFSVTS